MASAAASPSLPPKFRARLSRMARTGQVASSFAAVVVVYWLYWLIAVPLIEPSVERQATTASVSDEQFDRARQDVSSRQRDMAQYFPADAWEQQNPAIWESGQTRLLFKTLRPLPDGTVELHPCTVLMFSKNDPSAPPIILRALEGANVQFDQPIVLKSVDLAKRQLVGGRLIGAIRIYRNESQPGKGDDLEATTRDVVMLKDRISTPHPVQFRLGRNRGFGREMEILLAAPDGSRPTSGFRGGTMRTLQLKRDVKMELELGGGPLAPGAGGAANTQPVEIVCQGPFQFDMERYAASFRDQVDVFRLNPAGESDQLNCEVLTVFFERHGENPATPPGPPPVEGQSPVSAMHVRLIQARGDPVTLRSPAQGIYARCPGIDYAPAPAGAAGSLMALGPGLLQGHLPNDPSGKYDARWAREFRFEPEGPQHKATLRGAAVVQFTQMGKITADEIFAWLTPKSPPPAAHAVGIHPVALARAPQDRAANSPAPDGWQIERVLAQIYPDKTATSQGSVVIDATQLHGTTERLEALVDRPPAAGGPAPPQAAGNAQPAPAGKPARGPKNPAQRFDVRGRSIQLQLVPQGEELAISAVTIEHQARLQEISPARDGEKPLLVQGDRLRIEQANTEATHVTISGKPGYLEGGGITLTGGAIELEKRTNLLWVAGPGRMTMPVSQDLNGQPLARPQSLIVNWQKRMDFQSNTVVFQGKVVAQSEHQFLNTEKLEAILDRPIDFSNPNAASRGKPADKPQLSLVRCHGPAFLESRQFDELGRQTSADQLDAVDLSVDKISGAIAGQGPGWLKHVARGSNQAMLARPGVPDPKRDARPPAADDGLTYLHVKFHKALEGNLYRRQIKFTDRTKTVYGPVTDWNATLNPDDLASLGPQGLVLEARDLEVREMAARSKQERGWFELQAQGNVVATGTRFTAQGDRLTYSEEKDEVVLRGDGLSPAEVFREDPNGGARLESRVDEWRYWLTLHRVAVTGAHSFDGGIPSKPSKEKPGKDKPAAR